MSSEGEGEGEGEAAIPLRLRTNGSSSRSGYRDRLHCSVLIMTVLIAMLGGCAFVSELQPSVAVSSSTSSEDVIQRRGDVLSTGGYSALTAQTIRVAGLDEQACARDASLGCIEVLTATRFVDEDARLSALAELWLLHATSLSMAGPRGGTAPASAWIETARHAYAYLFFSARAPDERVFEARQIQVRDWYNHAVEQTASRLFGANELKPRETDGKTKSTLHLADWTLRVQLNARLPDGALLPRELLPASTLRFRGLRNIYRQEGLGVELVAVTDAEPSSLHGRTGPRTGDAHPATFPTWSEMPTPNVTAVLRFDVRTLDELLAARELILEVYDPLQQDHLTLHGQSVPLAGNFTAGYGLWLARSEFGRRSLRGLLGREHGIDHTHLYLMQPFDPRRRVIVMLHGLASSPEAWVDVANELLADDELRRQFQVWQVYYPTNAPVQASHLTIRQTLRAALDHFDPAGESAAMDGLVLIGHSMGGIIARLMVSTAEEQLWEWIASDPRIAADHRGVDRTQLDALLRFQPFPGVERAIFIAAPHRGTAIAGQGLARWLSGLIRLPMTLLDDLAGAFQLPETNRFSNSEGFLTGLPNSLDQLDQNDPFIKAASALPISDRVTYHSIIGRLHTRGALVDSDDGLVPYRSAHLEGAASEKIIVSGHRVQETTDSIMEIRRILREDIAAHQRARPGSSTDDLTARPDD